MITRNDIEKLFQKQLSRIKNKTLRNQVVKVWVEACKEGGWNSINELVNMPFTLLTNTHGINFIEHTIAVTEGAIGLADAQTKNYKSIPIKIDYDRLVAGGLLHDIGKLLEIEKDGKTGYKKSRRGEIARHPISGAILAAKVGIPEDIINCIACHAKEGEGKPQFIETVFIHQADFATFDPLVMKQKGLLIE
ncbi:MAG: hypothetical protein IGBAC_1893 [Ignavibacteriae bacterium]|nr:MAG: hypothetical protein IGBAC_1893 [Ignavibacteriota bacterium]